MSHQHPDEGNNMRKNNKLDYKIIRIMSNLEAKI
jgi:hypothetical protein